MYETEADVLQRTNTRTTRATRIRRVMDTSDGIEVINGSGK